MDRREPGPHPAASLQLRLELGQREVGGRLDQPAQLALVRLEHGPPVPAVPLGRGAAGRAHPLHQLDRGRRADGKPPRGATDRAAALDRADDPQPQVHGDRCWHGHFPGVQPILSNHGPRFHAIGICSSPAAELGWLSRSSSRRQRRDTWSRLMRCSSGLVVPAPAPAGANFVRRVRRVRRLDAHPRWLETPAILRLTAGPGATGWCERRCDGVRRPGSHLSQSKTQGIPRLSAGPVRP